MQATSLRQKEEAKNEVRVLLPLPLPLPLPLLLLILLLQLQSLGRPRLLLIVATLRRSAVVRALVLAWINSSRMIVLVIVLW